MDYGFTVRKFQATGKCYSCDPGTSVGISKDGDFIRCTNEESGLPDPSNSGSAYSESSTQQVLQQGPQGPAVDGDATYHANMASSSAQTAMQAAEEAAIHAQKAAEAATARYRQVSQTGSSSSSEETYTDLSSADMASQHQMATQVRAEQALRTAETAHISWKAAMQAYNAQLALLRKQQILTDKAEKTLQAAEETSEKARKEYAAMQADAQHALETEMMSGGSAASRITSRAAAEELAGTAQAAQQRLLIAAKEARDAASKISISVSVAPCAPTMPPLRASSSNCRCGCLPSLLQVHRAPGSPAKIGCEHALICDSDATSHRKAQNLATPRITPLVSANQPSVPVVSASPVNSVAQLATLDADAQQSLINVEPVQTLEIPNIEQQLTQNLAQKLAENPAAVEDPSVFAAPTVPFAPEQMPVDGTEKVPSFDFGAGGMVALQKSDRRMLRQGK